MCFGRAFEPVEAVGAQQNEVNHQCQSKQEREQGDQRPARIEKSPYAPHVDYSLSGEGHCDVCRSNILGIVDD